MKIITAKGKEFETDMVTYSEESCHIRVIGSDWGTVATVFSDPEETRKMYYSAVELIGYTILDYIMNDRDAIKVRLRHG